ncbi:MAG: bifunctional UDP-N-acetylglucosamine diphosphorylase/glucosamine-1-phosphate N-acetyltransferase GlmU [Casimicrobiaceae bacterium]|nr:bifunctional UDP-N-acetylglucosamine diphosphorylase/glucosamine-1-phosphate N-acetyltransferase GlmU [Casimicrobiaceae bacterium]MDW8312259.1 bifunctional UDP-N-acetylglucosamine diphosphorylase/glucosamine-1-phosphate N-acetyltransferase GlmU [Burkholderiales bacterium]
MSFATVLLAAGKGTRMKSRLPKVLQPLGGQPLLAHVLEAVAPLAPTHTVVVVGHEAQRVEAAFAGRGLTFVRQEPQNGTGHAAAVALEALPDEGISMILTGDTPLVRTETLRQLHAAASERTLALVSCVMRDPTGYGRILRNAAGQITRIVEHKDAVAMNDSAVLAIREVNTGLMAAPTAWLRRALKRLEPKNAQGELYLTDVVALAAVEGLTVTTVRLEDEIEVAGVNDKAQLAALERALQARRAQALLAAGVTLLDPARLDIRGSLRCGSDVSIDVGCVFSGTVVLEDEVSVGPYCVLSDCTIGRGSRIEAMSVIEGAVIGANARIGPFARLRPGTRLAEEVHIGNFVETKNTSMGRGSKANHLAYLGDATVGARVNYGAGSITANYDGANKHPTTIEDDVHVGSNCVLVAPVTLGAGGTIGAGSVVTKNTPPGALTVARAKPVTRAGWKRPTKKT